MQMWNLQPSDTECATNPVRTKRPFLCPTCEKSYSTKNSLSYHMKEQHQILPSKVCDICSKSFKSVQALSFHFSLAHKGKTSTEKSCLKALCGTCGYSCTSGYMLYDHIRVKHLHKRSTTRECRICCEEVPKSRIFAHYQDKHQIIHCIRCTQTFGTFRAYKNHLNAVEKKVEKRIQSEHRDAAADGSCDDRDSVLKAICGICGQRFIKTPDIFDHILIHCGSRVSKNVVCNVCWMQVPLHDILSHKQQHKVVDCLRCGRSFPASHCYHVHFTKAHCDESGLEEINERASVQLKSRMNPL